MKHTREVVAPRNSGSLPIVIRNDEKLYEGDLIYYFQVLFTRAQNLVHPYHNFRHMCHVLWLCYNACSFYRDAMNPGEMRDLLIAALFHDFDHSGMMGNDDLNIERAVRGLRMHLLSIDQPHLEQIISLIRATEYPYTVPQEKLDLGGKILRDADLSQALSVAWIQQVVFGLATEWDKKPLEVLKIQGPFLRTLSFHTVWAQQHFSQCEIAAKINEAEQLVALLETNAT